MNQEHIPTVTDYLNYRQYLNDFYEAKKKVNPSYSYRVFVNKADVGSPSHLKMVIDGSRNLTLKTIPKYLKAIGFRKKMDEQFFKLLVQYNQEQDPDQKIKIFNEIMELKRKKGLSLLQKHQFNLLAHWFYVAIYVLIDIPGFKNDPEWISARLKHKVSPKQVSDTLDALEALELIEKDPIKGYSQTNGALSTDDDVRDLSIHVYHKEMIELAKSSLNFDPLAVREFNGVTLAIDKSKLNLVKEKIRTFRREMNELTTNMEDPDQVYQLNIQFFPLTEVTK
ncbi:MAG: TIGR02147 family protein [Bacteriovoracia bacterium]